MGFMSVLKATDSQGYYLLITFMIIIVMTFLVSIYAAIRVDKMWSHIKRQQDMERIRKEVKSELRAKES